MSERKQVNPYNNKTNKKYIIILISKMDLPPLKRDLLTFIQGKGPGCWTIYRLTGQTYLAAVTEDGKPFLYPIVCNVIEYSLNQICVFSCRFDIQVGLKSIGSF